MQSDLCSAESVLLALHYSEPFKYQSERIPPDLYALAVAALLGKEA
jgi:hypothetical protein